MTFFKNNLDRVSTFSLLTLLILFVLSYVPPFEFWGIKVRSLDITSLIVETRVSPAAVTLENVIDTVTGTPRGDGPILDDMVEEIIDKGIQEEEIERTYEKISAEHPIQYPIRFEDYSADSTMSRIASRLKSVKESGQAMRIAFLGDSFIEADILTADVREQLQHIFGGNGVGFVPIASVANKYRYTIDHTFSGWTTFSMVDFKNADWKRLTLTGFYYIPEEGATFSIKPGRRASSSSPTQTARLLFINEKSTQVTAIINGSETKTFSPPSSPDIQTIDIYGEINSISFSFNKVDGFVGYGVYLNDEKGVYVDNYSVRGSSGLTLSASDKKLSSRFNQLVPYDVIILQYGINVTGANITNYSYYRKKMIDVVKMMKSYFPNTAFIIMGVSDRAMKNNNSFETMPGILAMVEVQRQIAKETGSIFWDTFAAMGGKNSMLAFVSHNPPLASKDYTHINHAGGKRIAESFVYSLIREVETFNTAQKRKK